MEHRQKKLIAEFHKRGRKADFEKIILVLNHFEKNQQHVSAIFSEWKYSANRTNGVKYESEFFSQFLEIQKQHALKGNGVQEYYDALSLYLEIAYTDGRNDRMTSALNDLKDVLQTTKQVEDAVVAIDAFLGNTVFSKGLFLNETDREKYIILEPLFEIIHPYAASVDPVLLLPLKIKLANLPCSKDRKETYPNLYLTKKEQVEILLTAFEKKQNDCLVRLSMTKLSKINLEKLKKLSNNNRYFNKKNNKLLTDILGKSESEKSSFQGDQLVSELKRLSKIRSYFEEQKAMSENELRIPRWYHATDQNGANFITSSKKILVMHQKLFTGAWVASYPATFFGKYVIAMDHDIENVDPKPFIGFQKNRWRGVQKEIPLKESNRENLCFVTVPCGNKMQKPEKTLLKSAINGSGYANASVHSDHFLQVMRHGVEETLGCPNLNSEWWSSGFVKKNLFYYVRKVF